MKKILYSLYGLLLFAITGCVQDEAILPEPHAQEGKEITVHFSTVVPEFKTVTTRANGGVNDLYLLVFDENGNFIVRRQAVLTNQTETGGTFTAQLPSTAKPRTVHFVSNYDWTGFNDSPGVNEATVVALLSTANATFWSRVELSGGISATSFSGITVQLLRNQAKISVTNEASNFIYDGFVIHNTPGKGTVAPYSVATGFTEGTITEPSGVTLTAAQASGISTAEKYLFERKNAAASSITTVIVRGTYAGQSYYYKIDLIDANKNRYDIERNWHYVVKIKTVTRAGYANFNDALAGASHNNTALDPIIEKYPMISDGTSKLEVEKTLVILTQPGQTFQVWAKYFPDINSSTVDNSGVTVALAPGNEALNGASLSFNPSTGIITATALSPLPSEPKEARIVVTKGDLARTIRVVLRTPFSFDPITINNANPATLSGTQSQDATLRFTIPSDFPADLLPLPIRIYAQGLYPASTGLQMVVENGQIHYIYMAASVGQQTVNFKTNKSGNAETVSLKADYFVDGAIDYNIVGGTITYGGNNVSAPAGTLVPSGATVTASTGTVTMTGNGQFRYSLPTSYNNNTSVTFTYTKQVNNYKEEYSYTTTIGTLLSNGTIALAPVNFIFEGTIKYKPGFGSWTDVPSNGTVSIVSGGGTITMTSKGNYRYTVSASTPDNQSIQFKYSSYKQTKTIGQLKTDSSLTLQ